MIKAVFFDCDGVLVDSERFDQSLNEDFIRDYHLDINPKAFYIFVGSSPSLNTWDAFYAEVANKIEWSKEEFREIYRNHRRNNPRKLQFKGILFEDVPRTLRYLKEERDMKVACASSSSPEYIERALAECEIKPYFDLQVSGYDFKKSKPSPDIYLFCRDQMGLRSEECLVIEDSPYGIEAAIAAGMPVLARRDTLFSMDQSKATRIIDSLDEVRTFLEG